METATRMTDLERIKLRFTGLGCRLRRLGLGLALAMIPVAISGCAVVDPAGLLESEATEAEASAAETAPEQEKYPKLAEVPKAPAQQPSTQRERQEIRESLASDEVNARYSGERLRSPEASPDSSEMDKLDSSRKENEKSATRAESDAPSEAQAMPKVPAAPSESQSTGQTASVKTASSSSPESPSDGMKQKREGQQNTSEPEPVAQGDTTPNDGAMSAPSEPGQDSQAVTIDRSQIPQIEPSRKGEPIQLPASIQRQIQPRSAQRQFARLQPPPSDGRGVPSGESSSADSQRVAIIYFGHAGAALRPADKDVIRKAAGMQKRHGGTIRIIGHASSRTATMDMIQHRIANLDISMKRAENVADSLTRYGVSRDSIRVEARSDRDPVYHEFMPTGEAGNRRAEIFLIE